MHEMSIVEAILEKLPRLVPPGAVLRAIEIEAGPLRAIDPGAMQWAWQCATAATAGTGRDWQGVRLDLRIHPYRYTCRACAHAYEAAEPYAPCPKCQSEDAQMQGTDELRVISIDIDDAPPM